MIDVLKTYPIMSNDTNREKKILNVLSYYSRQHSYSTVSNDTNRQKKILSVNALSYYHHIAFNVEILIVLSLKQLVILLETGLIMCSCAP